MHDRIGSHLRTSHDYEDPSSDEYEDIREDLTSGDFSKCMPSRFTDIHTSANSLPVLSSKRSKSLPEEKLSLED